MALFVFSPGSGIHKGFAIFFLFSYKLECECNFVHELRIDKVIKIVWIGMDGGFYRGIGESS